MKRAAPLAMLSVTLVYMLVNVAYYAVVDKEDIAESGRIVAALYFGKLWGVGAERVCEVVLLCTNTETNYSLNHSDPGRKCYRGSIDAWEYPCSSFHARSRYVSHYALSPDVLTPVDSGSGAGKGRSSALFLILC